MAGWYQFSFTKKTIIKYLLEPHDYKQYSELGKKNRIQSLKYVRIVAENTAFLSMGGKKASAGKNGKTVQECKQNLQYARVLYLQER